MLRTQTMQIRKVKNEIPLTLTLLKLTVVLPYLILFQIKTKSKRFEE